MSTTSDASAPILYCHCAYAQVIPPAVKQEVLARLSASGAAFEAVPDLCELAARKDPLLARLARTDGLRIAACFPRAVRWLFHGAGAPLPEGSGEIWNMRELPAEAVAEGLVRAKTTVEKA